MIQEAEAGTLFGNMVVAADAQASGGQFVHVPIDVPGDSSADFVEYSVNIETAGSYQITAVVRGPNGSANSFFAQIDEGPLYLWSTPNNNEFTEDLVSDRRLGDVTETLSVGIHTFRVFVREEGTQLDSFEFELLSDTDTGDTDSGDTDTGGTGTGGSGSESLFQEAESGTLFGDMVAVSDPDASGGQFVHVPGSGLSGNTSDFIEFSVAIETAGNCQVNARVRGSYGQNSFFAQLDEGPLYRWDIPNSSQFIEDLVSNRGSGDVTEFLSVGTHTLRVFVREQGSQLDWIELLDGDGSGG